MLSNSSLARGSPANYLFFFFSLYTVLQAIKTKSTKKLKRVFDLLQLFLLSDVTSLMLSKCLMPHQRYPFQAYNITERAG